MIANTSAPRPHFRRISVAVAMTLALLEIAGCGSNPEVRKPRPVVIAPGESVPEPTPAEPEQAIELNALAQIRDIAAREGTLAARGQRNALLVRGLDAATAALIDSHIAWLEGDLKRAEDLLNSVGSSNDAGRRLILAERRYRAEVQGQWLEAAQLAHRELLLGGGDDPQMIKEALWSLLMHLDDNQLSVALLRADGADWRGWLQLNQAYRRDRNAVNSWLATHQDHSAVQPMPAALEIWLDSKAPANVAVLLPLSDRLQSAGEAVLGGIIESLYLAYPDSQQRPRLITVDTDKFSDAISAYRDAIRQGANLVLGPLTKVDAQALGSLRERPVPVVALNRPEALPPSDATGWSALSLAPEDEARQIAQIAFGRGQRRALIVRPDTDWGRRMEAALVQRWRQLGATVVDTLALNSETPESEQISQLVSGFDSEARIRAMEQAFEAPVESRARRRQDFDVVFLMAPGPTEARSLRPLLVYHYSGDVPVYASSAANSGHSHLQNRDLNELMLVETPAVLNAVNVDRFTRLAALGKDAIAVIDHWQQAEATQAPFLRAQTGLLHRQSNGEIERELIPVTFDGGDLRELKLP